MKISDSDLNNFVIVLKVKLNQIYNLYNQKYDLVNNKFKLIDCVKMTYDKLTNFSECSGGFGKHRKSIKKLLERFIKVHMNDYGDIMGFIKKFDLVIENLSNIIKYCPSNDFLTSDEDSIDENSIEKIFILDKDNKDNEKK